MEEKKNDIEEVFEIRQLTRMLRVSFSPMERIVMGQELASAYRDKKEKEEELASVASRYKSDIKEFEAKIAGLVERINSGWEMKKVDCEEIRDFRTGNVIIRRVDTGEHVEERAMTFEERQPKLPLTEKEATTEETPPNSPPQTESPPPDLPDKDENDPFYDFRKGGGDDDV